MTDILAKPASLFLNRELGILEFNARVLAQAADNRIPLLERLKYLCIVSSNMDEFFEIRMAVLKEQLREQPNIPNSDGLTPLQAYREASARAQIIVKEQYDMWLNVLMPLMAKEGIYFHVVSTWNEAQRTWARDFFFNELLPVLTPIGLDPAHPFPRVLNKSLNFAVSLVGEDAFGRNSGFAIVQAPRALPRLIAMPDELSNHTHGFVFLSSFMQAFVGELFPQMEVTGCYQFRVTRNSDLFVDEDEITDLRTALQGELPHRHFGDAVRLELSADCPPEIAQRLITEVGVQPQDCYRVPGPVNLVRLMQLPDMVDRPDLKFPPYTPVIPTLLRNNDHDLFSLISQRDILLHHPYESFNPVLELVKDAATDPNVVAIKQTIYRTGNESVLMETLIQAARNGKEVTVVVELLARFDEETNINWAARLEAVGAHVVYGVVGHKCHAKMLLIVRREPVDNPSENSKGTIKPKMRLKRYAHLGTGNYHSRTAKLYTDFGLLTSNEQVCEDVHFVFQQLTGLGKEHRLNLLWQSPFTLLEKTITAIRNEAKLAASGKKARIIAKMNALQEPSVIEELYKASQAGVKIELIVRGFCTLAPGVPGLSENIQVRSIIGRYLEHSRVYYFYNDGKEDLYLSSADWMDRNLLKRVEVAFPILDKKLKARVIKEGLLIHLKDNYSSWIMNSQGGYARKRPSGKVLLHSQGELMTINQPN